MYVSQPGLVSNNHLIAWASLEGQNSGYKSAIYTLSSVMETGVAQLILKNIDEQYFSNSNIQQSGVEEIYKLIENYLNKEHGKGVKVSLKNKILNGSIQQLVKLIIYCCLHSKKKQQYVQRIIHLDESIQSSIMIATQCVGSDLFSIQDLNEVVIRIEQLQNQVQVLRSDLSMSSLKEQSYRKMAEQLEQQLNKKENQIKGYKSEKQKVIQTLQLTNFNEYLSSFQRLQQQNRIINGYMEELQDNNKQHQRIEYQLRKDIENQTAIILDLNENITLLKQKLNTLKLQTSMRFCLDDTCDVSRSFGTELTLAQKQNLLSHKKQQRRKSLLSDFWLIQQSSFELKKSQREQALQEEMKQLRKYNSDLIHKLQTVYKTLNTNMIEIGLLKQKSQTLVRQNKFYRKQMNQLRKIHERMQNEITSGMI